MSIISINASDQWHAYLANVGAMDGMTLLFIALCGSLVLAAIVTALLGGNRHRSPAEIDKEISFAFGVQCPNCSARATEQRGRAVEKRHCTLCGLNFEVK